MDDYTDTKIDTDNWTTLGVAARNVVSKLAAGDQMGISPPAASPLHHAAEWMELPKDDFRSHDDEDRTGDDPNQVEASETVFFISVDFGFVVIFAWHRRYPLVCLITTRLASARA